MQTGAPSALRSSYTISRDPLQGHTTTKVTTKAEESISDSEEDEAGLGFSA